MKINRNHTIREKVTRRTTNDGRSRIGKKPYTDNIYVLIIICKLSKLLMQKTIHLLNGAKDNEIKFSKHNFILSNSASMDDHENVLFPSQFALIVAPIKDQIYRGSVMSFHFILHL